MSARASRPSGVPLILLGVGLLLTIGLFTPYYRPWMWLGPILLAAGAAIHESRPKEVGAAAAQPRHKKGGSAAGAVSGVGLMLLLVGGCPWVYTPFFFGGESNSSSGMLGTLIFLLIGLPGLTITAVGLANMMTHQRPRVAPESHPGVVTNRDASVRAVIPGEVVTIGPSDGPATNT